MIQTNHPLHGAAGPVLSFYERERENTEQKTTNGRKNMPITMTRSLGQLLVSGDDGGERVQSVAATADPHKMEKVKERSVTEEMRKNDLLPVSRKQPKRE